MDTSQFTVIVHSEKPEALVSFYEDVIGLQANFAVTHGAFMAGSSSFPALIVEGHSGVRGAASEPARVMLNFVVDDIRAEEQRLRERGVSFIRPAEREPGVGMFATFADPDGNYCQLIEFGA